MTHRSLLPSACLAAASLLLISGTARAHGIESSLQRFGGLSAQLQSSFSSGDPARAAQVRLIPPAGHPIELGRTDAQGRLSFQLPPQAGADWEIQVDAGPGHRDYLELPPVASERATRPSPSSLPRGRGPIAPLLSLAGFGLSGLLIRRPRA